MRLHRSISRLFGYDMIRLSKQPTLESHLKAVFDRYSIDLVIDVGANTGQYAQMLRNKIKYQGEIISFEPVSTIFEQLVKNSDQDCLWEPFQLALGASNTCQVINITESSDYSSFYSPNKNAKTLRNREIVILSQESVQARRLDDFLSEYLDEENLVKKHIYLKIDTQGHDLEVMKGA